jgi:hypothetical protein
VLKRSPGLHTKSEQFSKIKFTYIKQIDAAATVVPSKRRKFASGKMRFPPKKKQHKFSTSSRQPRGK